MERKEENKKRSDIIKCFLGKRIRTEYEKTGIIAYHESFKQSGIEKAKWIIQDLNTRGLNLNRFAYFSVGGSIGAEINFILANTDIERGLLLEYDSSATDLARSDFYESSLKNKKVLEIVTGDATQKIEECKKKLIGWRNDGYIDGLVCSIQAVLHELPYRSPKFELNHFIGEIVWDWDPFLMYCREPCCPIGLPEIVKLYIPDFNSEDLEVFANDIKVRLSFDGDVRRSGKNHITLPGDLCIEVLHKYFYPEDYLYEIQEKLTTYKPEDLIRVIESQINIKNVVSRISLNSKSFEQLFRDLKIEITDLKGVYIPMPASFIGLIAVKNTGLLKDNQVIDSNNQPEFKKKSVLIRPSKTDHSATIFLPDAGLAKLSPPISIKAFSLDQIGFASIPFDIGTYWGLDRGKFIGILASLPDDDIYQGLIHVERALYDSIRDETAHGSFLTDLPVRWWVRIDPLKEPNGPIYEEEVWGSAIDSANPLVKDLKQNGLAGSLVPGIFFDVRSEGYNDSIGLSIAYWCENLMYKVFPSTQVAVLVNVTGSAIDESTRIAQSLRARLVGINPEFFELTTVFYRSVNFCLKSISNEENTDSLELGGETNPGFHFSSWVRAATRGDNKLMNYIKHQQEYDALMSLYNRFSKINYTDKISSAWQVIKELDTISPLAVEIDRQFLQFVRMYLPELIHTLISAYSTSVRSEARRETLIFASQSDSLMDAWVDGNSLKSEYVPKDEELIADPKTGAFVDKYVLALLRKYHQTGKPKEIKILIEDQRVLMGQDLKVVCDYCFEQISLERFLSDYGPKEFQLALQAGVEMKPPCDLIRYFDLSKPALWWLIIALPPNKGLITELLNLDSWKRAIFGLCSREELQEIQYEIDLKHQITDCRRLGK